MNQIIEEHIKEFEAFRAGYYAGNYKTRHFKNDMLMEKIIEDDFIKYLNSKKEL